MKSKRELFLDAEAERMKARAFQERERIIYREFITAEGIENARNRLNPKWRKTWDLFHEHWLRHMLPADTGSPMLKKRLARAKYNQKH